MFTTFSKYICSVNSYNAASGGQLCGTTYIYVVRRQRVSEVSRSHTETHTHTHNRQDSSGRVISPTQRLLPHKTQHSRQTSMHPQNRRDSNPQSQQASSCRTTPQTARTLGPAYISSYGRIFPLDPVFRHQQSLFFLKCYTLQHCEAAGPFYKPTWNSPSFPRDTVHFLVP